MKAVQEWLNEYLNEDDVIVVAVSGGPDSMTLLSLLTQIRKKKHIDIICAHVNHKIRKESEEEAKFVQDYCKKKKVKFEKMEIEEYGENNFHDEARKKRYDFFEKVLKKYNSYYLMTAHHGDDLMETILMRLVRGSSMKGYSGFQKTVEHSNYTIIRPLIEATKEEIEYYAKRHKIPFVTDKSNSNDKYTRNRYRKYILPKLKEEEENVHLKFSKFSKMAHLYDHYVEKEVKKYIEKVYIDNILNLKEYSQLDELIKYKIIEYILEKVYQDNLNLICDQHVKSIIDIIHSNKPNIMLNLPNNIIAKKSYNQLRVGRLEEYIEAYQLELADDMILPNNHRIQKLNFESGCGNDICRINLKDIKLPLMVRTRKNGDKIYVKGMLGRKKVNDIFIENKIDKKERDLWPLVVDKDDKIVWVPGLKKSKIDVPTDRKCDIILKYY